MEKARKQASKMTTRYRVECESTSTLCEDLVAGCRRVRGGEKEREAATELRIELMGCRCVEDA